MAVLLSVGFRRSLLHLFSSVVRRRSPSLYSFSSHGLLFPSPLSSPFPSLPHPKISHLSSSTSDFETDSDEPSSSSSFDESDFNGFLQLLSQAKSISSSQKDALAFLRASSGVALTTGLVCKALWELRRDSELAFLAFRWAEDCVLNCPWAWHLMVWTMGKQGRFDLAWCLVRRMYRKSVPTQRAIVIMMERYAAADEARKAIKTFQAMDKFKVNADSKAYYALLCALCKHKFVEEAEEFLLLNKKFFPLSIEGFNIVLDGWCNIMGDVAEAKRVWREMASCCITPNGVSYSHMICCFSRNGNLFDSLRLYDEMKKRGWSPNLTVYNSLIYILTRESCLKDANNVFDKIIEAGFRPDIQTYNSMIYPLCEAQRLEEARAVMEDMMVKGIHPSIETYHSFAKSETIEGTLKLLKKMKDAGCGPNSYTFHLVLDKFSGSGECENALMIWAEMRRYNVIADASHYMSVIQGMVKHGWILKAQELYNEMKSRGFPADPKLENIFITFKTNHKNHWGKGGKEYIFQRRVENKVSVQAKVC